MRPNTIIDVTNVLERDGYIVGEVTTSEEISYREGSTTHIKITCRDAMHYMYNRGYSPNGKPYYRPKSIVNTRVPAIKNVIFNDPATIVIWADGTKTVVKAQNDEAFDPEKGLAMAITKKVLGNQGNYYETIKKWVEKYEPTVTADNPKVVEYEAPKDIVSELSRVEGFLRKEGSE